MEYYEERETGLGYDFAIEVYSAIKLAVFYPDAWQTIDNEIRRSLVKRFPYGVLYSIEDDYIFIVAVMHLRQEPNYWRNCV